MFGPSILFLVTIWLIIVSNFLYVFIILMMRGDLKNKKQTISTQDKLSNIHFNTYNEFAI